MRRWQLNSVQFFEIQRKNEAKSANYTSGGYPLWKGVTPGGRPPQGGAPWVETLSTGSISKSKIWKYRTVQSKIPVLYVYGTVLHSGQNSQLLEITKKGPKICSPSAIGAGGGVAFPILIKIFKFCANCANYLSKNRVTTLSTFNVAIIVDCRIPNMCSWRRLFYKFPEQKKISEYFGIIFKIKNSRRENTPKVKSHRIYFTIFLRFWWSTFGRHQTLN